MDLTVDRLKIGAKLVLGKYGVHNDSPHPIVWLKASLNCDFISESVLDYICFDARERASNVRNIQYYGNPCLLLSNIHSFLNSDADVWFNPTHEADVPPSARNVDTRGTEYESHFGFLYHFDEYEIDSLKYSVVEANGERLSSLIRLPMQNEILGADRFKLFLRKGVRPNGTEDMVSSRYACGFDYTSYVDFWTGDRYDDTYVRTVSRSGNADRRTPKELCGLRPVCSIKPETVVVSGSNDTFYIKEYVVSHNICTDEELLNFLGLARP